MDYTLNIVSKYRFSLYLNIRRLRKGPGKFLMGVLESPGLFVSKRVGTLDCSWVVGWFHQIQVRRLGSACIAREAGSVAGFTGWHRWTQLRRRTRRGGATTFCWRWRRSWWHGWHGRRAWSARSITASLLTASITGLIVITRPITSFVTRIVTSLAVW